MFDIIKSLIEWIWKIFDTQRKIRFTVHKAIFMQSDTEFYFLNITNLSKDRKITLTHVWFETKPQTPVFQKDRLLPKILEPDETWETFIESKRLPEWVRNKPFNQARVRLSNGKTIKSKENKGVPEYGNVPGGEIRGL